MHLFLDYTDILNNLKMIRSILDHAFDIVNQSWLWKTRCIDYFVLGKSEMKPHSTLYEDILQLIVKWYIIITYFIEITPNLHVWVFLWQLLQ
jgi:hypothetical protein